MSAPFNARAWVRKSVRGGMEWPLLADDRFSATKIRTKTWRRIGTQFYPNEKDIIAALRTLVGPGDWYLRADGNCCRRSMQRCCTTRWGPAPKGCAACAPFLHHLPLAPGNCAICR
jgi:hypothetical protein